MAPPPPPSAIETASASSTAVAAAAAAAPAEPPPPSMEDPHDECVLCCYPLPLKVKGECQSVYKVCCGEEICMGCIIAQQRTLIIGTNVKKPIQGSREEELEFIRMLTSEQIMVCPFCRAKDPTNYKEYLKRLWERIDDYKDPEAMNHMGWSYESGEHGLTKNLKRAEELYQQAYDLGDATAANILAELYINHIPDHPDQQARIMKFLEEGIKRGSSHCNNRLGFLATKAGHLEEAKRFLMTAARSGHEEAMRCLIVNYQAPGSVISKEDFATILRAHKAVRDNRKSEPREYARRHKAFQDKMLARGNLRRK